ncbi:MAG: epoxyqueuosine reductase QueH [Lachnospiraceae bacterium]|nr:epoxyqueuosine reductase QueH [Lachnospiraceae bacterium]
MSDEELLFLRKEDYQGKLDRLIERYAGTGRPKLLLHACCAPCSSYCLEYLLPYFDITLYYYNPNITEKAEYEHRVSEVKRLTQELGKDCGYYAGVAEGEYEPARFLEAVRGYEDQPEGGLRCVKCFRLRLSKTAEYAAKNGYGLFSTTLTISPLKNAAVLNELGREQAELHGTEFMPSDFKKKNGYKRSIELSRKYGLYRQDYCGCAFSKAERERQRKEL